MNLVAVSLIFRVTLSTCQPRSQGLSHLAPGGREVERPWERGCLHATRCQSVKKVAFSNVAIFWAFAAFFPAYVLTEALFVKRNVVIWVVVMSMEAIKLRSEVVWIEIISTLLLCWLYIPIRHGIFLNVFATIRSTNSLVSSSLSPR